MWGYRWHCQSGLQLYTCSRFYQFYGQRIGFGRWRVSYICNCKCKSPREQSPRCWTLCEQIHWWCTIQLDICIHSPCKIIPCVWGVWERSLKRPLAIGYSYYWRCPNIRHNNSHIAQGPDNRGCGCDIHRWCTLRCKEQWDENNCFEQMLTKC